MRKRIIISLLAVVVIGVVAFFVSQPKEGAVEWHKRQFTVAHNKMFGVTLITPLERVYWKLTGKRRRMPKLTNDEIQLLSSQMDKSRSSLLKLGYLAERTIVVSDNPWVIINKACPPGTVAIRPYTQFLTDTRDGTNKIVITAQTDLLPKLEELIRKADVPEGVK